MNRLLLSLMLVLATCTSQAQWQLVHMQNLTLTCDYDITIYYGTGSCVSPGHWVCSGGGTSTTVNVPTNSTVNWNIPSGYGICAYDISHAGTLITSCTFTATNPACTYPGGSGCFIDCQAKPVAFDMNVGCDTSTGKVQGDIKISPCP